MRSSSPAAAVVIFLVVVTAVGCKRGEVGGEGQAQTTPEQAALQDLLKYAQQTGQTLEQLRDTLTQWQAAQEAEKGPSPVSMDLNVLSRLLDQARAEVQKRSANESLALITRMTRVSRCLLAELPGQQVAVRVERALSALSGDTPDAAMASQAILAAINVCVGSKDAALVPNVVKDLEAAKGALSSDISAARDRLFSVLEQCANDNAARWAYYMVKGLESAFEAVQREAWPVASAELEQVGELISKLRAAAAGTQAEKAAGEKTTAPEGASGGAAAPAASSAGGGSSAVSPQPPQQTRPPEPGPETGQERAPAGPAAHPQAPAGSLPPGR